MEKKILFLDFDGVLFDTLKEVYLVNRLEYLGAPFFDEINKKTYDMYYKYKYLVYNIWMFYYFNPIIFDEVQEEKIEQTYNNAISNRNIKKEEEFCNRFLKIREDLIKNHNDFWQTLETPYEFFFEIKKLYESKDINLLVVSKKNKASILKRFNSYGFNIDENKVVAREILNNYSTKEEFMKKYMLENDFQKAIFVDDNVNNLLPCKNNPSIKTILALWGNIRPDSVGFTQKEAIIEIQNFFSK